MKNGSYPKATNMNDEMKNEDHGGELMNQNELVEHQYTHLNQRTDENHSWYHEWYHEHPCTSMGKMKKKNGKMQKCKKMEKSRKSLEKV